MIEFKDAGSILVEMGETFRERNKVYGDNYKRVGEVMNALFPDGVELKTVEDRFWKGKSYFFPFLITFLVKNKF